ncbi:hypothetical protein KP509_31G052500 [Ceratopteris richardii]|nr:hypothetical protein KP509_31G052500 [Ceratopteris richardii]KAH7288990.1 hypothetical protein KP509_31G052500 [Ceratopteris richardii]
MRELADGTAAFEFRRPTQEVPLFNFLVSTSMSFLKRGSASQKCFARINSPQTGTPPYASKIEHYAIHRVKGDGRCMFRALALGMAFNDERRLSPIDEQKQADNLRIAVEGALCSNESHRQKYEEALIAITIDESLNQYCRRIRYPDFWGGESELLVLSRLYQQPVIVYIPEHEMRGLRNSWGSGFVPIAEYGLEYTKITKDKAAFKPVRLLYSGGNHYDLLI